RLGIPPLQVRGRAHYLASWGELTAWAWADLPGEDAVAPQARQLAERILRETALLFAHTDVGTLLLEAPVKDDQIRLPPGSGPGAQARSSFDLGQLRQLLGDDTWGDLGFFALLLRRASTAILRRGETGQHVAVGAEILQQEEYQAFDALARA